MMEDSFYYFDYTQTDEDVIDLTLNILPFIYLEMPIATC